jgi:hypothetical protein
MKNTKPLKKSLSLSKQCIRNLTDHELRRVDGAFVYNTVDSGCYTLCLTDCSQAC